jgi:2-haloacid dehalogenase
MEVFTSDWSSLVPNDSRQDSDAAVAAAEALRIVNITRRQFVASSTGVLLAAQSGLAAAVKRPTTRGFRGVLFDALPLFDLRRLPALAQQLDPAKGAMLVQAWRSRQFEYQWLRALGERYVDFWRATEDSLSFAAHQVGMSLTREMREQLMGAYSNLEVWPDVSEMLPKIQRLGLKLGLLSNMTESMLESGLARAHLRGLFSHVLSTDRIRSYKPARQAYQLGVDALGLERTEILFVAFAGWDVAGAVWFGYPSYWLNRFNSVGEELGAAPIGIGTDLQSLYTFLSAQRNETPNPGSRS